MDISQIYREHPHFRTGYGSVTGRLRTTPATTAGGKCQYRVTEQHTGREVECIIPPELVQQAADAAAQKRGVVMSGTVHRNADGQKERVEVSQILALPEPPELLSLDELQGSMRGMTGGLTTEEFLRIMRSDGYDDFPDPYDD